jgi:hypothetical protein
MLVDKEATREARKKHQAGMVRLAELFDVTPDKILAAKAPRPKARGGASKNGAYVARRRFRAQRRTTLRMAGEFMKRTGAEVVV